MIIELQHCKNRCFSFNCFSRWQWLHWTNPFFSVVVVCWLDDDIFWYWPRYLFCIKKRKTFQDLWFFDLNCGQRKENFYFLNSLKLTSFWTFFFVLLESFSRKFHQKRWQQNDDENIWWKQWLKVENKNL